MGIALGYAFLVAIAGGLVAICVAHYLYIVEENESARNDDAVIEPLLYGAPSVMPAQASLRSLPVSARARTAQFPLTSK